MYTLQLQASDDKGHRTGEVTSVRLSIIPPLWERTWLRGFVGLALGAGGVILIRRRIRTARDKERSRRALLESELQTLRAQMNPHFIFNTLTLVQHSLLHGDAEGAQTILGDFALLLRRLLEHSRQELAPIARELELLRAYIDLEAIRYDGEFRYELDVDPTLNGGWRMPTMIMQPIVENAIKHGLRPRGEGGILRVILRKAERSVIWCIEDNGIGRAAAEKMTIDSKGRSEPFGLRLTEERLKLLGKDLGTDASIKLIDLYGADGEPAGTRVVVTVPIQEAE
jgi:LytS/YehU family sensor histidine kinase